MSQGAKRIEEAFGSELPIAGARLAGKTALVSGAGTAGTVLGVGGATAILLAAQGAAVTLFDKDRARAETTAALIEELGGRSLIVVGDVTAAADCASAVRQTVERFGGLDVLINNAAVVFGGEIDTITDEVWDTTVDVNMKSVMLLTRAAAAALGAAKGAVVNVASIAAQQGFGALAYSASKGGVISMTRDMAYTLGKKGVRVNCLVPGHLATPMGGVHHAERRQARVRSTILGVEGSAWDAAWAALFLSSPEARWITGTTLNVDAGSTMLPSVRMLGANM